MTKRTPEEAARECALKEGIDLNFDLRELEGAISACPHGKPYSFKRIFLAGVEWFIENRLPEIVEKARDLSLDENDEPYRTYTVDQLKQLAREER